MKVGYTSHVHMPFANRPNFLALLDSIKADHGFNMDSKSVRNLLQTMSELSPSQRRDFLQFVTGSPKLPIGGKFHLGTRVNRCPSLMLSF